MNPTYDVPACAYCNILYNAYKDQNGYFLIDGYRLELCPSCRNNPSITEDMVWREVICDECPMTIKQMKNDHRTNLLCLNCLTRKYINKAIKDVE